MDTLGTTERYLFLLAALLIAVAYYVGTTNVLKTTFAGATALDYAATGRTSQGTFANYPH